MAISNSWYESIMRDYSKRRTDAISKATEAKEKIYEDNPRLSEIDALIASESINAAKEKINGNSDALNELRSKIDVLKKEKEEVVQKAGFSMSDLEPKFECCDCKDTGFIEGRRCHCFRQALLDKVYEQSRLSDVLHRECFDNFNLEYYSKTKVSDDNVSAYDNAANVLSRCVDFCDNFNGKDNILLYGKPGIGKTFLTHCIAGRLLSDLHSVIYLTADELITVFEQETFDKDEIMPYDKELILDVDALIIDDLGTEFVNSFTSSKIFTCINERLLRGKSTVISTNLSLQELLEIYSERTFSRISQFTILKLFGDDIRIMKKALR
ncbi:MAG: ATP-binding protein [Lachnospiraceae bacterium]|nr:ATP-binding protein [Lachnospiraceae bacterium]